MFFELTTKGRKKDHLAVQILGYIGLPRPEIIQVVKEYAPELQFSIVQRALALAKLGVYDPDLLQVFVKAHNDPNADMKTKYAYVFYL